VTRALSATAHPSVAGATQLKMVSIASVVSCA
jgi:hypothetical protein